MKLFFFLLAAAAAAAAAESSLSCPALFFVVNLQDYLALGPSEKTEVDYGNYILRNGTQFPKPYYLPSVLTHDMWNRVPCALLITIVTDDARVMKSAIQEWILSECARLGKTKAECYSPKTLVFSLANMEEPRPTVAPTLPTTEAPTIPQQCEARVDQVTCEDQRCHWFGAINGCHLHTFCDLDVREACTARKRYCKWSTRLGCVKLR